MGAVPRVGQGKGRRADLRVSIRTERWWRRSCKQFKNPDGLDGRDEHGPRGPAPGHRQPRGAEYPHDSHDISVHRICRFGLVLVIESFPGGPWWNDPKRNLAIRPGSKLKGATHVDFVEAKGQAPKRSSRTRSK